MVRKDVKQILCFRSVYICFFLLYTIPIFPYFEGVMIPLVRVMFQKHPALRVTERECQAVILNHLAGLARRGKTLYNGSLIALINRSRHFVASSCVKGAGGVTCLSSGKRPGLVLLRHTQMASLERHLILSFQKSRIPFQSHQINSSS